MEPNTVMAGSPIRIIKRICKIRDEMTPDFALMATIWY